MTLDRLAVQDRELFQYEIIMALGPGIGKPDLERFANEIFR